MRIVHTESSCGWGGQEIRILTEARGMQARGHHVSLLCPPQARIYSEAANYGVPVEALAIGRKNLEGVFSMRRWLASHGDDVDVMNTHSSTDSWLTALALRGRHGRPAMVRTRHISAAVAMGLPNQWLYGKASAMVVTTGSALREELIRRLHLTAERVISVPTGIDLERYIPASASEREECRTRLGLSPDTFTVGIVATLRSWKGHRFLIDAVANLPLQASRPFRLVIVGDGPQRAALVQQVATLGVSDRIIFAGNQSDVVPWLHAFDLFALPSYANEGVPQALLQAMACGVPVVTTDAGAIGEIAQHDSTALIVAQQDAAAIAAAIARVAGDALLARTLSANARALVKGRHSLGAMLDQMEAVFSRSLMPR